MNIIKIFILLIPVMFCLVDLQAQRPQESTATKDTVWDPAFRIKQLAAAELTPQLLSLTNPFDKNIVLTFELQEDTETLIEVVNLKGQSMTGSTYTEILPKGIAIKKIDTRQWAKGLYIIRLVGNGQIISKKVIKQ